MANPIGAVAMLTLLLSSGTALADHHVPIRAISDIKVTNTNKVHFELRNGNIVVGNLPNCPVMEYVNVVGAENLGLHSHAHGVVKNNTKITFLDLSERKLRKRAVGSCRVSDLQETMNG